METLLDVAACVLPGPKAGVQHQLFYQLFFLSTLSTLSTFYQLFISCLSTFYQLFINVLSTVYQLFINIINFLSTLSTLNSLSTELDLVVHSLVEEPPGIADLL